MPSSRQPPAGQALRVGPTIQIRGALGSITLRFVDQFSPKGGGASYLIDYDLAAGCTFLTVDTEGAAADTFDVTVSLRSADLQVANVARALDQYIGGAPSLTEILRRCELHTTSRLRATLSAAAPTSDLLSARAGDPQTRLKRLRRISQVLLEAEQAAARLTLAGFPSAAMSDIRELLQRSQTAEANALAEVQIAILRVQQEIVELANEAKAREREQSVRHESLVAKLTYMATCLAIPILVVNAVAAAPPPDRRWNILLVVPVALLCAGAVVLALRRRGIPNDQSEGSTRGASARITAIVLLTLILLAFLYIDYP